MPVRRHAGTAGFPGRWTLDPTHSSVHFNVPVGVDRLALGKKIPVEIGLQLVAPRD